MLLEVKNAVIVLQKLCSEDPILFLIISNNTDIIRWRKREICLVLLATVKLHVGVEGHFDVLGFSRLIGNNVEFQIWKRHILFFSNCARPEWLIVLAVYIVLFFEEFQKTDERLVWDESETHSVVDNKLLRIA